MAIYKRGRVYWYEFSLHGWRYRASTKRANRQQALHVESSHRTRLLDQTQGIPNPVAIPPFGEFADKFLAWAESNLSMSTVKLHRINVALLKKHFRGRLLTEIDRASVEELKTWRSGQKRKNGEGPISPATVNRFPHYAEENLQPRGCHGVTYP